MNYPEGRPGSRSVRWSPGRASSHPIVFLVCGKRLEGLRFFGGWMRQNKVIALAASAVIAGFHRDAKAASATRLPIGAGSYSWVNDANWSATHPDGAAQVASVNSNSTGIQLITLDSNSITVGTLNLADTVTQFFGFNIGSGTTATGSFPADTLVFDNSGSTALLSNNIASNNTPGFITAPVTLNDNLAIVATRVLLVHSICPVSFQTAPMDQKISTRPAIQRPVERSLSLAWPILILAQQRLQTAFSRSWAISSAVLPGHWETPRAPSRSEGRSRPLPTASRFLQQPQALDSVSDGNL